MAFVYFFCLHGAKVLVSLAERQKRNKQKTNTLAPWRHAIAKISFSLKNSQNWLFLGSNRGFGSTKIFIILVTYLVYFSYQTLPQVDSWPKVKKFWNYIMRGTNFVQYFAKLEVAATSICKNMPNSRTFIQQTLNLVKTSIW